MNEYMNGVIDACMDLADTKKQFIDNIGKATGMTAKGISGHKYIQGVLATWKKQ